MSQHNTVSHEFEDMILALDAHQLQAVYSGENIIKITAGPGTGKTFVLVCRVLKWILLDKIDPCDIIVLAYTKNAVEDLKERFVKVLGREVASNLIVGTFSSICLQYMNRDRRRHGLLPIKIHAKRRECLELIRLLQRDDLLSIDDSCRQEAQATHILDAINKAKRHGISPEEYSQQHSHGDDATLRDYAILYTHYQRLLTQRDLFDFDEILFQCLILFKNDPDQLFSIKKIVVDNYQDINPILKKLIDVMSSRKSITIAGDEQQAIFGWRYAGGAAYSNFHSLSLQLNYRSTRLLVQATTEMMGHRNYITETLVNVIQGPIPHLNCTGTVMATETLNPQGIPVSVLHANNEFTQANLIAREILRLVNDSSRLIKYNDCAVLLRTHSMSLRFEEAFSNLLIPYKITDAAPFFLREEIVEIVDYLKFSLEPHDIDSFHTIINVPNRGITDRQINTICQLSRARNISILDALRSITTDGEQDMHLFSAQEKSKLQYLSNICTDIRTLVQGQSGIVAILEFVVSAVNYRNHLRRSHGNHEERWNNLQELCSMAPEFCRSRVQAGSSNEQKARAFLRHCLDRRYVRNDLIDEKVLVCTMHTSKGCEWPCVFIPSCIEGIIPICKPNERIDIDEEHRLLYVAMTRARFFLYCIVPRSRFTAGFGRDEQPSRFLKGMRGPSYSNQAPVWSDQVRSMLGLTLGRTALPAGPRIPQTQ